MGDLNQTQIPSPRIPLLVPNSTVMSREWFRYLQELAERVRIAQSLSTESFSGFSEVLGDKTSNNDDTHLYCLSPVSITLQAPITRTSELIVTNASLGIVTIIGTVNEKTDMQLGSRWTSIRLRPTLTAWVVV